MKHLSPIRLSALADGLDASAPEAAHLRACTDCRGELAGLRALVQGLEPMPAPPKGLHQATLQRLGLEKAAAIPAWQRPWLWGPALAAGLAIAVVLPRFQPAPAVPSPATAAAALNPAPQPGAKPALSLSREPLPHHRPAQARAKATRPGQAPAPAGGSLASAPAAQAPQAVGAQPAPASGPEKLDVRGDGPGLKSTPGPGTLSITAVRNNLLHAGSGDRFSLVLQMAQAGPLDAVVLDARGRVQASLFHGPAGPGQLELQWDGVAPSGAYTVLIQLRDESQRVRVLVVH